MQKTAKTSESSSYTSKDSWYLVYTQARGESRAVEHLQQQSYETYFPQVLIQKRQRGRLASVVAPMFPRYVFIRINNAGGWAPIRSTRGVQNLVRFGGVPARVPNQLIELLYKREHKDEQLESARAFREGQIVRLMDGPLCGYEAIFKATSGQQRAFVLLDLLGKQTNVEVKIQDLDAV